MFEPPSRAARYSPVFVERNVEVTNHYLPAEALDLLRAETGNLAEETPLHRAPQWVRNVGSDVARKSQLADFTLVVRGWVQFGPQDQSGGVTDTLLRAPNDLLREPPSARPGEQMVSTLLLTAVVVVDAPTVVAVYERDVTRGELLIPVLPGGVVRLLAATQPDDYVWISTSPTADHGTTWSELFPPPYREDYRDLFAGDPREGAVLNYNYRLATP